MAWRVPEHDNLPRHICEECRTVHYQNPRMIVGTLPVWEESQILLCRRAIEPRHGFWTVPCGFMENGETAEQGALRETTEEANARVTVRRLHCMYSIPHINQVYLVFLAELDDVEFYPGPESLEVRLFREDEIPWDEIAFSSVRFSLERYFEGLRDNIERTYTGSFIPQAR